MDLHVLEYALANVFSLIALNKPIEPWNQIAQAILPTVVAAAI